jgi:hypothetical protein
MDLYDLRNNFDKFGIMMCFNGPFSHSIIEEIGKAVRNHLAAENIAPAAVLDVFAVYIELAQNVRNYLALREITLAEATSSIITIAKREAGYAVSSGNIVLKGDGEALCRRISEVNAMTPEERKRQYRELLRRDVEPGALGAGLGFLEIAKRSSQKMACSVRAVDNNYDFITQTAFI